MKITEAISGKSEPKKPLTPSQINKPTFLLNFPQSLSTADPNNSLMKKMTPAQRKIDHAKANDQFMELNKFIVNAGGVVYLLPSDAGFQDQTYVSNLGIYLPHIKDRDVVITANFRTPPRRGEELVGQPLFELMGYEVYNSPDFWEGQAELRYIRDDIYIGGWGQRSAKESYEWMKKKFDMKIPTIRTKYPDMYHLDCMCVRITPDKILCPKEALTSAEIKDVEQYVEIINMPLDIAVTGSFNGVRCGKFFMCRDPRTYIEPGTTKKDQKLITRILKFHEEVQKISGLEPKHFDLSEFEKSGADLGCLIMHLNYFDYF